MIAQRQVGQVRKKKKKLKEAPFICIWDMGGKKGGA